MTRPIDSILLQFLMGYQDFVRIVSEGLEQPFSKTLHRNGFLIKK